MREKIFSYLDYAWEILTVAEALPCGVGEAFDRFRADVADGRANDFNTAETLPETDFAAAKQRWEALDEEGQEAARAGWRAFATRRNVLRFIALLRAGNRAYFDAALDAWREEAGV